MTHTDMNSDLTNIGETMNKLTSKARVMGERLKSLEDIRSRAATVYNNDERIEAYSLIIKAVRQLLKQEMSIPANEDYTDYV